MRPRRWEPKARVSKAKINLGPISKWRALIGRFMWDVTIRISGKNQFGWYIDPVGFRITARQIYARYALPLIVTENGLGAFDRLEADNKVHDDYRIAYLREHIAQLQLALTDGVELFGYCPWSAIDLVSTHQGVNKRYGFIYVNRDKKDLKDLARYRKKSFSGTRN